MFLLALMRRSLARVAGILAGLMALLVGLQVLVVLVAASQERAQSFDLIAQLAPSFVQRQFGSMFPALLSFGGLVTFGYFHPVVLLTVALFAAFIGTELAADVEGGHVDLLLSRPLARHWLVTRSTLLVLAVPVVLVVLMMASTRLALGAFAPEAARWPSFRAIGAMAAHLVAIAWCFGALGLAWAAPASRRMSAMGPVAVLAVALFLLDFLANAWRPAAPLAVISPFHYYQGITVLTGAANTGRDLLVLASAAAVAAATAYWSFAARDM
jgi:ABC-2 type transport system permease protein